MLFIMMPVGISGDTSQVRTSPPKTIGCMSSTETLVVRLSSDSEYASASGESSTESRGSHSPSPSSSSG